MKKLNTTQLSSVDAGFFVDWGKGDDESSNIESTALKIWPCADIS